MQTTPTENVHFLFFCFIEKTKIQSILAADMLFSFSYIFQSINRHLSVWISYMFPVYMLKLYISSCWGKHPPGKYICLLYVCKISFIHLGIILRRKSLSKKWNRPTNFILSRIFFDYLFPPTILIYYSVA